MRKLTYLLIAVLILGLAVSCSQSTPSAPASAPPPASASAPSAIPEPTWWPDSSKVVVYPRYELEKGVVVSVPDDMRIVPFEIRQGERMQTLSMNLISGGGWEYFFRDSKGNFVLESPLGPWPAGTYYLHIRNESPTSEHLKVTLRMEFTQNW